MPGSFCKCLPSSSRHYKSTALSYPHALHHLELLQHAEFRSDIMKDEWRECLNQKQFDHWRTWSVPPTSPLCCTLDSAPAGENRTI